MYAAGDPTDRSDPSGPLAWNARDAGLLLSDAYQFLRCASVSSGLKKLTLFGINFWNGFGALPGDVDTGPGWLAGARISALSGGLGRGVGLAARDVSGVARGGRFLPN